jgi:hypothetical protein
MAALPAGIPAFEAACRAFNEMKKGKGWVDLEVPAEDAAPATGGDKA